MLFLLYDFSILASNFRPPTMYKSAELTMYET